MPPHKIEKTLIAGDFRAASLLADGQFFGQVSGDGGGQYDASQYEAFNDPDMVKQLSLSQLKAVKGMPPELFTGLNPDDPMHSEHLRQLNSIVRAQQLLKNNRDVTLVGIDERFRSVMEAQPSWKGQIDAGRLSVGGHLDDGPSNFARVLHADGAINDDKLRVSGSGVGGGGSGGFPDDNLYMNSGKEAAAYFHMYYKGMTKAEVQRDHGIDVSTLPNASSYFKDHKYTELINNKLRLDGIDTNRYGKLIADMTKNPEVSRQMVGGDAAKIFKQEVERQLGSRGQMRSEVESLNTEQERLKVERGKVVDKAKAKMKYTPPPDLDPKNPDDAAEINTDRQLKLQAFLREKYPDYGKLQGRINAIDDRLEHVKPRLEELNNYAADKERQIREQAALDDARRRLGPPPSRPVPIPPSKIQQGTTPPQQKGVLKDVVPQSPPERIVKHTPQVEQSQVVDPSLDQQPTRQRRRGGVSRDDMDSM